MKVLLSLLVLAAIAFAVAWFGYGIHPKALIDRVTSAAGSSMSDMSSTGEKFRRTATDRLNEAEDVYHGKTEADDPFAYYNAR